MRTDFVALTTIFVCFYLLNPALSLTYKQHEIYDLESTLFSEFVQEVEHWEVYNNITFPLHTNCSNVPLLGGTGFFNSFGFFRRNYTNLTSHNGLLIRMTFWFIDDWNLNDVIRIRLSDENTIFFDQQVLRLKYDETTWTDKLCGDPEISDLKSVKLYIASPHTKDSFILQVLSLNDIARERAYFGFRDIVITTSDHVQTVRQCGVTLPLGLLDYQNCDCQEGQHSISVNGINICVQSHSSCLHAWGGGASDCYSCKDGHFYDGKYCVPCDPTCKSCDGPGKDQCITCKSGEYFYANSSCLDHCDSPFSIRVDNANLYCDFFCAKSLFLYQNMSCLPHCSYPYVRKEFGTEKYCDRPCDAGISMNPDQSCTIACNTWMVPFDDGEIKYCLPPCDANLFYYPKENACKDFCNYTNTTTNLRFFQTCTMERFKPFSPIIEPAVKAINIWLILISFFSFGYSWAICLPVLARMFQYVRYFHISYDTLGETMTETWKLRHVMLRFGITIPDQLSYDLGELTNVSPLFARFGVDSNFLINFWDTIICLGIAIWCFTLFKIIEFSLSKIKKAQGIQLIRWLRIMGQNFIVIVLYSSFGNVIFFSVIQFQNLALASGFSFLSIAMAFALIVVGCVGLYFHFMLLYRQQKLRKKDKDPNDMARLYPGLQILFKDFKNNYLSQEGFIFFFIIRDILFSLIISIFITYPFLQSCVILLLNFTNLLYVFSMKPFRSFIDNWRHIIFELILLCTNACCMVSSVLDDLGNKYPKIRETFGEALMYLVIVFNYAIIFFFIVKIIELLTGVYNSFFMTIRRNPKNISSNQASLSTLPLNVTTNLELTNSLSSHLEMTNEGSEQIYFNKKDKYKLNLAKSKALLRLNKPLSEPNETGTITKKLKTTLMDPMTKLKLKLILPARTEKQGSKLSSDTISLKNCVPISESPIMPLNKKLGSGHSYRTQTRCPERDILFSNIEETMRFPNTKTPSDLVGQPYRGKILRAPVLDTNLESESPAKDVNTAESVKNKFVNMKAKTPKSCKNNIDNQSIS